MRNEKNKKKGALSVEQCVALADKFIASNGACLFIVDIMNSSRGKTEMNVDLYVLLHEFADKANEKFSEYFPANNLAVGDFRTEQGFDYFLGDATWVGINSSEVIPKLVELKETEFPDLPLYYGVAEDGWGDGMVLAK